MPERDSGRIFAIVGAKGGVGKTTIATNLAAAIATHTERSVLLVDLDTRFGDIALLLDLQPTFSLADLARVFRGELSPTLLRQAVVAHDSRADILAAPSHPDEWSLVDPEAVRTILRLAAQTYDYVLLDTPGPFTDLVGVGVEAADEVLLTTAGDRTSVRDATHLLRILAEDGDGAAPVRIIVNRVQPVGGIDLQRLKEGVGQAVACEIPYDEEVMLASALGEAVVLRNPQGPASRMYRLLASQLVPLDAGKLRAGGRRRWLGLLRRLVA